MGTMVVHRPGCPEVLIHGIVMGPLRRNKNGGWSSATPANPRMARIFTCAASRGIAAANVRSDVDQGESAAGINRSPLIVNNLFNMDWTLGLARCSCMLANTSAHKGEVHVDGSAIKKKSPGPRNVCACVEWAPCDKEKQKKKKDSSRNSDAQMTGDTREQGDIGGGGFSL